MTQTINLILNVTPEVAELLKPLLVLATAVQDKEEPEFISIRGAVERCPYAYNTLYKWIVKEGRIPSKQPSGPNGKYMVRLSDFDEFIENRLCSGGRSLPRTKKGTEPFYPKKEKRPAGEKRVGRPRKEPAAFA